MDAVYKRCCPRGGKFENEFGKNKRPEKLLGDGYRWHGSVERDGKGRGRHDFIDCSITEYPSPEGECKARCVYQAQASTEAKSVSRGISEKTGKSA